MMAIKKIIEWILPPIAIIGISGFFLWQTNEREVNSRVDYENGIPKSNIAKEVQRDFESYQCNVIQILDGDSLNVNCDGKELRLRLCGIDAPEQKQHFGEESTNKLRQLAYLNKGQVEITKIELDRSGRTIAEVNVWSGRVIPNYGREYLLINSELIRAGLAYHYKEFSSNCHNKYFIGIAEDGAIANKVSVWSNKEEKPWDYRKRMLSPK
jgi:endonuclease YncB( thermonuclease family)